MQFKISVKKLNIFDMTIMYHLITPQKKKKKKKKREMWTGRKRLKSDIQIHLIFFSFNLFVGKISLKYSWTLYKEILQESWLSLGQDEMIIALIVIICIFKRKKLTKKSIETYLEVFDNNVSDIMALFLFFKWT